MSQLTLYFPETSGFDEAEELLDESDLCYTIGYEEELDEDTVILGEKEPTLMVEALGGVTITHKGLSEIETALENLDQSKYPSYDTENKQRNDYGDDSGKYEAP